MDTTQQQPTAPVSAAAAAKAAAVARLQNRDYYVVIDKSGSMEEADTANGKSRWDYCQESTIALAKKLNEFDPDGITVVPFSSQAKMYPNTTPDKVKDVFAENWPAGSTNLAAALQVCFDDYVANKKAKNAKPNGIMIVCVTDGEPDNEDAVASSIVKFTKQLDHDDEAGISFLQVGKCAKAAAYLKRLDDHLEKEGAKFDIVNAKTVDDLENVTLIDAMIAALDE